jgi:GATA-binding protein
MIRPALTPSAFAPSVASPSDAPLGGKLDLSLDQSHTQTRRELLREAFFPDLRDDATGADWDHPDEMQKNDPLGTHMWKIVSKVKTQIANHERMENMTWRLMAMSLKKKGEEQAR